MHMARRKTEGGEKGCTSEGHVPKEGTAVQARQRGRGGSQWGLLSGGEMCIWVGWRGVFCRQRVLGSGRAEIGRWRFGMPCSVPSGKTWQEERLTGAVPVRSARRFLDALAQAWHDLS